MTDFQLHNAQAEDLQKYPDFFARAALFNTLNQPAQPQTFDQNFISRMTARSVDKLVFYRQVPVFYLSYKKAAVVHPIETMILDDRVEVPQDELYHFIRTECFDKVSLKLMHDKFEYHTCDRPLNESVLEHIGFLRKKNHRVMNLPLEFHRSHPLPEEILEHIRIAPVETSQDMTDRVNIQNGVFHDKSRTPLVWLDVQTEMKNKSYIDRLSLLLRWDGTPCAYGQIITNSSAFYLVNFGVLPPYQGRGLAHILLDALLNVAKEQGIRQIMLEVYEDNTRAISLYEEHGFKTMYNKSQWIYQKKQ